MFFRFFQRLLGARGLSARKALLTTVLFAAFGLMSAFASHSIAQPGQESPDDLDAIYERLETRGYDKATFALLERYVAGNGAGVDEALMTLGRRYETLKAHDKAAGAFARVIAEFQASPLRSEALLGLGALRYRTGRAQEALSLLKSVASSTDAPALVRAKAKLLVKEIEKAAYIETSGGHGKAAAIGALLPMKGAYARFGDDALKGILLAANVFGASPESAGNEVILKDAGEGGAGAISAMAALASDARVAGVIGPLSSASASEAARSSEASGISMMALSQKEMPFDARGYVFRNFPTLDDQAAAIVDYSCRKGNKTHVILYPQNNYGVELARLFAKEAAKCGASIVAEAGYKPGTTDFGQIIRQAFGVKVKERKEGRRQIREYIPSVKADALFIPDSYESIGLIAPYLEYHSIKDVRLLGTSAWNSSSLAALGGKHVEGAVFVDGFFAGSTRPETVEFVRLFKETYGTEPGALEAHAYDGARMLIAAMQGASSEGDGNRRAVKDALIAVKGFRGATGDISFVNGEARKKLFVLTIKGGRIVEMD
jgi:ABC-type branched-subunit amino acid transport system substrate-binding protein